MRLFITLPLLVTPGSCFYLYSPHNSVVGRAPSSIARPANGFVKGGRITQDEIGSGSPFPELHIVARGGAGEVNGTDYLFNAGAFQVAQYVPPQARAALLVNTVGFGLLEVSGKRGSILTPSGTLNAWILGVILWGTLGAPGWGTCVLYLFAGSAVTKIRKKKKESMGIAEGRGGARGPENVWGSAATGAMCAIGSVLYPRWATPLKVGFVASLATKLSDTFASEIGKAYGKRTFLITTLKPVPPGTEGAVSLEGTLAGVLGSLIIAAFGAACGVMSAKALPACLVAAFMATNFESVLGATTQGKLPWLTNEVINFVNTLVGAALAVGFGFVLGR